jgi:hypothetical protein
VLSTNPTFTSSNNQVTLSSGTWLNSPTSYTYQIATSLANLNAGTYVLNSTTTNSSATYTGSYSTTYHGKVTATNAYGSTTSGNFTATTGANLAPAISGNFPILSQPNASVPELSLSKGDWTNSPTGYIYYLQLNGSVIATHPSSGTTTATSYLFTGLQYNTQYGGAVTAVNAYGSPQATSNAYTTAAYVPPPIVQPEGSLSVSNVNYQNCTATFTVTNASSWDIRGSYVGGAFYLGSLNASSPVLVTNLPSGASGVSIVLNMWTGANRTGTLYQVSTTINVPSAPAVAPGSMSGLISGSYNAGADLCTFNWSTPTGTGPFTYYYNFGGATFSTTSTSASKVGTSATITVYAENTVSAGSAGTFTVSAPASSAPSTPTGLSNSYSSGPTWSGSWSASTGTAPITYNWTLYQASTNGGNINAVAGGSTTSTSFTQSMSSGNGLWAYFTVSASNSVGISNYGTSAWA